ncbi:MAG: Lipoyl-[acyl-carrier-protein]-protein-N-lipoyltransferase [Pseudomonadota bacterium]|jgi:lipoyl(octanoyl) transferase
MSTVTLLDRGIESYAITYAAMREFTDQRNSATPDAIWMVQHTPVFTLGLAADPSHILQSHQIPIVQTDRGGEVTYHAEGQAVLYLLFDLRRKDKKNLLPREFVNAIEQAVIDTLAAYNLSTERHAGAPGIYVADGKYKGAKIAALGLKIRGNGCTYHGVALNVAMDLTPFTWINPCGYEGLATVDMQTLGVHVALAEVQQTLATSLIQHLQG